MATAKARLPLPPHPLTNRQREILQFVADGMTNREVAHQINISVRTVEAHRSNLMRRLHVTNVAQLLGLAMSTGIVRTLANSATTKV